MGMDQELYRLRAIIGHQGPLLASDPDWKGSKYNVQVEWETGEITFEPLSIIAADDPVTCAAYAKENDLLALEGWRRFRSLSKKDKVLARAIRQSKIRQVRRSQTYMFRYFIPRNYMEAIQFDSENNNSKWYDAIKLEMESMSECKGIQMDSLHLRSRDEENPSGSKPMPTYDPSDLIGRTFLLPPEENGERHRAKVTRQVVETIDQDNG